MKRHLRTLLMKTELGRKFYLFRDFNKPKMIRLKTFEPYLDKIGWFNTNEAHLAMDEKGEPLPWLNYAFIRFLEPRIRKEMSIMEFGSGQSTLWWSKRVSHVMSVEHDREWFARMSSRLPANVTYQAIDLEYGGAYSKALLAYKEAFDIIVIDGRDRVNCSMNSLQALKPQGVIIWDNSERSNYEPGYAFLREKGFKRIDFESLGPVNSEPWTTSIFYRSGNNCLDI